MTSYPSSILSLQPIRYNTILTDSHALGGLRKEAQEAIDRLLAFLDRTEPYLAG